jgi:hypothetical protein
MLLRPSVIHTCYAAHCSEYNVVAMALSNVFGLQRRVLLLSFGGAKPLTRRPSDRDSRLSPLLGSPFNLAHGDHLQLVTGRGIKAETPDLSGYRQVVFGVRLLEFSLKWRLKLGSNALGRVPHVIAFNVEPTS